MASTSTSDLLPAVRAKADAWVGACSRRGVTVLVYCTYRSPQEQAELFEYGRTRPGPKRTDAKPWRSAHQYQRAADGVPLVNGKCLWRVFASRDHEKSFRRTGDFSFLIPEWRVFAEEAERAGLEWAGRWKTFVEYCHIQDLGGQTIEQMYSKRRA